MIPTYTATSLEDIAKSFETIAENCKKQRQSLTTKQSRQISLTAEMTWREAANMLRNTQMEQR